MKGVAIVGGGQAAFELASTLRAEGYVEPIDIFCDERDPPYQRPPLSKAFLSGAFSAEKLTFADPADYEKDRIGLHLGARVDAVDLSTRRLRVSSGRAFEFAVLIFATGARVRRLALDDGACANLHYLRSLNDARRLLSDLGEASRIAVIGGGFIGLEVAASARGMGKEVVVVEPAPRLMARAVPPAMSEYFARLHAARGVDLRLGRGVAAMGVNKGRVDAITLDDETRLDADIVVAGIGVQPNDELAQAAGLAVQDGIVVDAKLRTAAPDVYAIGDCARFPDPSGACTRRLESVQNAVDQARAVAAGILGRGRDYTDLPWFWSDQFDAKLQIAGLLHPDSRCVARGDIAAGKFSLWSFRDDRLVSVDSVGRPADHMAARKILAAGIEISPDQASDPAFDLKALIRGGAKPG